MKKYADKNRKDAVGYKVGDKVLLSTKNLIWQMRNKKTRKLTKRFIKSHKIKKILSENTVELELPILINKYLVVNVNRTSIY